MDLSQYENEIIHFIGGPACEYLGELVESPHDDGWFRIKNPCQIGPHKDEMGRLQTLIVRLGGPYQVSKPFVDIYIPASEPIEIRVLDKDAPMCNQYRKELERVASSILSPDHPDFKKTVTDINKKQRKRH